MHKLLLIAASLLLPLIASGEVLDKSSFLRVEQDAATGEWVLECESEISGIDESKTYGVAVHIYGTTVDPLTLTRVAIDYVNNNFIEIPPGERRYREVVDGVSDFEIVKFGKKFAVRMNAIQPVAQTGDKFSCLIQIYKVIAWPNELERLYLFKTDHEIGNSGEPNPLP